MNIAFDTTGVIKIYTGAQPANADAAVTGTLLGTLTLAAASFGAAASRAITAGAIASDTSADATGTAGWFRIKLSGDGDGVSTTEKRLDGAIGSEMTIDNSAVQLGGTLAASSLTYTHPA